MVVSRLRDGFVHRGGSQVVAGRTHEPFVEHGLRSNSMGPSARLFVSGCRKAKHLRGGVSKDVMASLGPNKILAMDSAYIEGNREMISLVRIDLDMVFPTPGHAIAAIRDVVDAGDLPCMPHLIAGVVGSARIRTAGDDGLGVETVHADALIRPHLWVVLPPGSAVNAGPNGRPEPMRLFAGVARGVNSALLHLGADPAASPFLVRGKNPLSPFMWSAALNNDVWPTLSEWAGWVDTRVQAEVLSRQAAEVQSGLGKGPSNVAFTTWQKAAYSVLRDAHRSGDQVYLAAVRPSVDPDALADFLRERMPLASLDRDQSWSEAAAERVFDRVVSYAASSWDPSRAEVVRKARGAMRHETDGLSTREAQAAAGVRSGGVKAGKALEALIAAYKAIVANGVEPTQGSVADTAGVNRRTAIRRWAEVVAGV